MRITDSILVVPRVVSNTYILVDDDGITVIDSGLPRSEKKILAYVESLGKSESDVKRIIITQSDVDHIGALAALRVATGARVYASRVEAEAIAAGRPSWCSGVSVWSQLPATHRVTSRCSRVRLACYSAVTPW